MSTAIDSLLAAARTGLTAPVTDDPGDPPSSDWDGRARVQLWRAGDRLAQGEATGPERVATVQRAAALAAARLAAAEDDLAGTIVEVEVVAELERLRPDGLSALLGSVELGLHGLVLRDGEAVAAGWPSDAQHGFSGKAAWVKALLKQARPPGVRLPASTEVHRFTTVHLAGPARAPGPGPDPSQDADRDAPNPAVELRAGLRWVEQDAVTRERVLNAALHAGVWLARHQRPSGLFGYEYQPEAKAWSQSDTVVRQAGCAWAMATLAGATQQPQLATVALRSAQGIVASGLRRGPGGLAYLGQPRGTARLGAVPLLLLAVDQLGPRADLPRRLAGELTGTILAVQDRSGAFGFTARGIELEGSETYTAGQCALALAQRYARTKRPRLAQAGDAALSYYRAWWEQDHADLSFLTWMLQACNIWDAARPTDAAVEFAYTMADWAPTQQFDADVANPAWQGGYAGGPGIGTAAYSEGMAAALAIARRRGDAERAGRYRRSLLLALRFLLQLTIEPVDLAFIGGDEHLGAVRASLTRRSLRCDNAQHLLMAGLRAAEVLPEEEFSL